MQQRRKITDIYEQLKQQREWIESCGGTLSGYIANYGDLNVAPLDKNGEEKMYYINDEIAKGMKLRPVEGGSPGWYYQSHFGNGGTAIYNADITALRELERELDKAIEFENRNRTSQNAVRNRKAKSRT